VCRNGGIGRRTGLKILREQSYVGSSPASGRLYLVYITLLNIIIMATLSSNELRQGTVFKDGYDYFTVLKYDRVVQGRGGMTVKIKVKNLKSGSIVEKGYKGNDKVESVDLSKRSAQFLYSDGVNLHFMDTETFDQVEIEGQNKYFKEGDKAIVSYLEGDPISVDIPNVVSLKVAYTDEGGNSGNTVSNALKEAKMETGITVMVPLFIKTGEVIKINTENNEYKGRK
jgi:elongation factor P